MQAAARSLCPLRWGPMTAAAVAVAGAVPRGDLCDRRDIQAVGEVLEPAGQVEVFQAVILHEGLGQGCAS
jgi:hypothetical protein